MKTLSHYLSLDYPLTVRPMQHPGGGYYAHYPDFGPANAHGDGDTPEAAVAAARELLELTLEAMLEQGLPVPLP